MVQRARPRIGVGSPPPAMMELAAEEELALALDWKDSWTQVRDKRGLDENQDTMILRSVDGGGEVS